MSLDFKRIFSSVMALIMICSSFVISNGTAVFADEGGEAVITETESADTTPAEETAVDDTSANDVLTDDTSDTFTDTADDSTMGLGSIDFSAISDLGSEVSVDVADALATQTMTWNAGDTANWVSAGTSSEYSRTVNFSDGTSYTGANAAEIENDGTFTVTTTGSGTVKLYIVADRNGTAGSLQISGSTGAATPNTAAVSPRNADSANVITTTVDSADTYTFTVTGGNSSGFRLFSVVYTYDDGSSGPTTTNATIYTTPTDAKISIGGTEYSNNGPIELTVGNSYTVSSADTASYTLTNVAVNGENATDNGDGSFTFTAKDDSTEIRATLTAVTVDSTTEATTETATETTTEATTEATETTTTAPVSGDYAQMGTYNFGSNAAGGTYNFTTKTLTTLGNVTCEFRDMTTDGAKTRKNDGKNNITLTLGSETKVTITSTDNGIVAVSASGTEYTFAVGTTEVTLPAGDYTIMGADSGSNSVISQMVLATSEPTYTVEANDYNTSNAYPTVTFNPASLIASGGNVTASWSANDKYQAGEKTVTLTSSDLVDGKFTVTVDPAWFVEVVTYTIKLGSYDTATYPTITLDKTTTTNINDTVKLSWDAKGDYIANSVNVTLDASMLSTTEENTLVIPVNVSDWFKDVSNYDVVIYDSTGAFVNGYTGTKAVVDAVGDAAEGSTIKVKDGYYEGFVDITKKLTIEGMNGANSNVVIYSNQTSEPVEDKMYPVVNVAADGVVISNVSIINTTYHDRDGNLTIEAGASVTKHSAVTVMAGSETNPCVFNNVKMVGIQDTVYINIETDTSKNVYADFNNCEITGDTDWICGGGIIDFNDCNFVFESAKHIGYIFAPSYNANWTVTGGTATGELAPTAESEILYYYYARSWMNSSYKYSEGVEPALNIYDLTLAENIKADLGSDGLMGFKGVVGDRKNHEGALVDSDFNAYSGDQLIATTNVAVLNAMPLIKQDTAKPSINYETKENKVLVVDFGNTDNRTFSNNVINDISIYGFAFIDETTYNDIIADTDDTSKLDKIKNAVSTSIENGTIIKSSALFKSISTTPNRTNSLELDSTLTQTDADLYYGAGIIESEEVIPAGTTFYYIPYLELDKAYYENNGADAYDNKEFVYNYGSVSSVTF